MSEEIIIDGVNVSGCKFYKETLQAYKDGKIHSWKGYGFCTHNIKGLNNAGCYAEDFARCLKNDCYYKQLKRLEQENEELKAIIEKNNKNTSDLIESVIKHKEKIRNYKQALEEIRKIMQENCNQCFEIDNFTKPDDCGICEWARVLKVINEVLKDER